MTDTAIGIVVREGVARRPGWLARLKRWFAAWLSTAEPEGDPTAGFSSREWADLPTYHPAEDR
jgi:hypothetical protein